MVKQIHRLRPLRILDGILSIPVRHGYRIRGRHAERTAVYCAAAVHPDAVVVDLRRQGVDDRETVCARLPVLPVRLQRGGVCLHEKIRDAVRAWSAVDNQDVVATLIVNEYREQGGGTIDFPDDVSRARQKLFRFLDNKFDSEKYRNNVRELTPAILAVLPLEYRGYLVEQDSFMARLAEMEKELSEAKQAVILNAPRHQKLKEISEGIVSMFRVDPDLAGPLMAMVTTMLGAI